MKFILFLMALLLCSFTAGSASAPINWTLPLILAILAGCYEVISRLIPTSATWSIIGKILEVVTWLSNLLDRKK